jgi:hypothetical protein
MKYEDEAVIKTIDIAFVPASRLIFRSCGQVVERAICRYIPQYERCGL